MCRVAGMLLMLVLLLGAFAPRVSACSLSAWAGVQNPDSALTAVDTARFDGTCGLRIDLGAATAAAYVEDATPGTLSPVVTHYVARFYIYIGDMTLADDDAVEVFAAYDAALAPVFALRLYANGGYLYTRLLAYSDTGSVSDTAANGMWLKPGWRAVELEWLAASGPGAGDGSLSVRVDGVAGMSSDNLVDLDNDGLDVSRVRLGLLAGAPASVTGHYDIDAFSSGRNGTRGLVTKSCAGADVHIDNTTYLWGTSTSCSAATHLELGRRVVVDNGATIEVDSPQVYLAPGFSVSYGGVLIVH